MKKKKIYSLRVLGETVSKNVRDDDFYTTDTDTWLEFSLVDKTLIPETMSISLVNSDDGAAINEVVTLTETKTILFRLDPEIIVHAGTWQGQLVFEANGEMYTSKSFAFCVLSNVMDNKVAQLIKIGNLNHFNQMLEELIQQGEEFEGIVASAREQIDENILTAALEDKYASLESEYTPRLTTLEEALANIGGGGGGPVDFSAIEQRITQTEQDLTAQLASVDAIALQGRTANQFMQIVNHGTNGSTARPVGALAVYWIGTATPANAQDNDIWVGG